jgi:hypothetical protein
MLSVKNNNGALHMAIVEGVNQKMQSLGNRSGEIPFPGVIEYKKGNNRPVMQHRINMR